MLVQEQNLPLSRTNIPITIYDVAFMVYHVACLVHHHFFPLLVFTFVKLDSFGKVSVENAHNIM
jgi:hypothetical protein